jgi:hypothetical protein
MLFDIAHQLVIGRMKLGLIGAVAGGVEQFQCRRELVGNAPELDHPGAAQLGAAFDQPGIGPAGTFTGYRFA